MSREENINNILQGKTSLGIELGSTRIKSVLINEKNDIVASGSFEWSNSHIDGIWTYSIDEIWNGVQASYVDLKQAVKAEFDISLVKIGAIGISAMMHGYMVFNAKDELLVPFRTWRNNITQEASSILTDLFSYPIPQRWSIAHLYQAIIKNEEHLNKIDYMTTLAGYVHWKLTGEKFIGVGEASGMFPIDLKTKSFNKDMILAFDNDAKVKDLKWSLNDILPKVLVAGENAGLLSENGARLLDPSGELEVNIPLCPPEGDAGTGMVATNSITVRTGNVSAGTSVFAMIVLEKDLKEVHSEIDLVTTPTGELVAMAHSNNCTTELNAWVSLFGETLSSFGVVVDESELFGTLYRKALEGDPDCGGLLSYGYHSGEHITHFEEGRPLFVRRPESQFNLANFMRMNIYTSLGALKIGLDILLKDEGVNLDTMLGHGGFFKTQGVGQKIMADAVNVPVTVMKTAGEGGAWGIALLAGYMLRATEVTSLDDFLNNVVFGDIDKEIIHPVQEGVVGFETFMNRYREGLDIERKAISDLI